MTHPSLFKGLPAPLADAMRELHWPGAWPDAAYFEKVGRLFESVDFPTDPIGVRAETLTAEQRAVAIALTELDLPSPLRCTTFPVHRAVRRRWLGLDPAGPLEQSTTFTIGEVTYVEPVWRMAKIIAQLEMPYEDCLALRQRFDAQFTLDERLRLWGEVNTTYPYIWDLPNTAFFNWGEDKGLLDQLRGEGKEWATDYLDAVLADANVNLGRDLSPAFIALVRAGAPLGEKWDPIFTLSAPYRYVRELLLALPEPRRLSAALPALKRMHPGSALRVVIEVLPVLPAVALAEYALSCIPKTAIGSPREHRRALRKAAGTHAEILALLDAADAAAGPPLVLTPTRERSIAEEGSGAVFSELDTEQLLACGKRYLGGKGAPLDVLLAENPSGPDEERSLRGQLFYRAIADAKGKHIYDAWLYQTDSGTIFKAGTTRVAAEVVHFSVTCKDDRLAEALEEAIRAEPSAVAEVPSPKKKAASKQAAKRP